MKASRTVRVHKNTYLVGELFTHERSEALYLEGMSLHSQIRCRNGGVEMSLRNSKNPSKSGHSVKTSALRSHNLASSDKLSSSVSSSSKRGLVPLHPTSTWLFLRLSIAYAVAPAAESVIMESVHFVRAAPTKCSVGPREESKKRKEKGLNLRTVNVKTINPSTVNMQTWRFKRSACRVDIINLLVSLRGNATLRVECSQATTETLSLFKTSDNFRCS